MGWTYCRVCGEKRKVDNVADREGYHQPPCSHCGDPGWFEPFKEYDEDDE